MNDPRAGRGVYGSPIGGLLSTRRALYIQIIDDQRVGFDKCATRFYIVAILLMILSLATFKVR